MATAPANLDRSTPVPLHYQVAEGLRAQIAQGTYRPGDLLPPEVALAEELGLSRATVRQAIGTLVNDGLLTRRRGVGTTIARPNLEQPLTGLYTFAELAAGASKALTTHVLRTRTRAVSSPAAEELQLRAGADQVVEVERLRLIDGDPLVIERLTVPLDLFEGDVFGADFTQPLYDLLELVCGVRVTSARERIRPLNLGPREAKLLSQPEGAAAFDVERTGMAGQRPVEWRRSLIRGDRYLYSVELTRAVGADRRAAWE
jgi:GntR family transcriptional regulator